jgi:hypothetical protein
VPAQEPGSAAAMSGGPVSGYIPSLPQPPSFKENWLTSGRAREDYIRQVQAYALLCGMVPPSASGVINSLAMSGYAGRRPL